MALSILALFAHPDDEGVRRGRHSRDAGRQRAPGHLGLRHQRRCRRNQRSSLGHPGNAGWRSPRGAPDGDDRYRHQRRAFLGIPGLRHGGDRGQPAPRLPVSGRGAGGDRKNRSDDRRVGPRRGDHSRSHRRLRPPRPHNHQPPRHRRRGSLLGVRALTADALLRLFSPGELPAGCGRRCSTRD